MKYFTFLWCSIIMATPILAQNKFSIDEAVNYGINNHINIKNSQLGVEDAELQIKELKATGMPQINGQFSYTYNAIIPTSLLPASIFNPAAAKGEVAKVKFGVPYAGQAGIALNQLIFDASYLVGLRAAATYRQIASLDVEKTKISVAENIIKAYYSVLVAEQRAKLLDLNISRMDTAIFQTEQYRKQGFVEQLDVDRLQVQMNNLLTEKQKISNLISLSYQLLKFQMAFPVEQEIVLKDKLDPEKVKQLKSLVVEDVNPANRIEFKQLTINEKLTELNLERIKKGFLPSVFFSGSLGASHNNTIFNPMVRWFGVSAISLGMKIPIYDFGIRKTQVARQSVNIKKIQNTNELLKQSFKLENNQAKISLKNGFEALEVQQRNMKLAENVLKVSRIKYGQGLGTNLEVVNAESDLKQAQNNFFSALYDVLISKVDLDKAQGNLLK